MTDVEKQILKNQSAILAALMTMTDPVSAKTLRDQLLDEYGNTGALLKAARRGGKN